MQSPQPSTLTAVFLVILLLIPQPLLSQTPRAARSRQRQRPDVSADVITELLKLTPPAPDEPGDDQTSATSDNASTDEDEDEKPPADDAAIKELIEYWSQWTDEPGRYRPEPSDTVRQRLLEAAENRPWLLPELLNFLPDKPDTHDRLHKLLSEEPDDEDEGWRRKVRDWLQLHSRYFREELIRSMQAEGSEVTLIMQMSRLAALTRLDWEAANPLMERLAALSNPFVATHALWQIYLHACESGDAARAESIRTRLKGMVASPQTEPAARAIAFEALMTTDWSGRDEWVISLFSNPVISGLPASHQSPDTDAGNGRIADAAKETGRGEDTERNVLAATIEEKPDKWLPIIAGLVGHANRTIHNAAVGCLALCAINESTEKRWRKQAAQSLLPWLANPDWSVASGRWAFIHHLAELKIPESIPGLIWILDYDEDASNRSAAAEALVRHRDARAVPALRRALERETFEESRNHIITALAQCGGISDDEAAAAIEAYARAVVSDKGEVEIAQAKAGKSDKPLPLNVSIGLVLYESETIRATEGMASRLFERVKALRASQPDVAQKILSGIRGVPLRIAELSLLERIGEGAADSDDITLALETRDSLRKSVGDEIYPLLKQGGHVAGIAAALLGDGGRQADVLKGTDVKAQRALLACARYLRDKLPVESVGKMLNSPNTSLAAAAESYLEVEDSASARRLVLARHPGEALILGDYGGFAQLEHHFSFEQHVSGNGIYNWEKKLREEVRKQGGAGKIYAMLNDVAYRSVIVRVRDGKAEISYYLDEARRQVRLLAESEFQELKDFTARPEVEDLGPESYSDKPERGGRYEYLRLTKDGGRRIIVDGLARAPRSNATPHEQLSGLFYRLWKSGEYRVRYELEDRLPGLEVLLAGGNYKAGAVCQEGREIRVLVEEKAAGSGRQRAQVLPGWRSYESGELRAAVETPSACPALNVREINELMDWWSKIRNESRGFSLWQSRIGETGFMAGEWNGEEGIWKVRLGSDPVKVANGSYSYPLVTPDGKWLIARRAGGGKEKSGEQLVRVNLQTRQESPVSLPDGYAYFPVAFISAHSKVLFGMGSTSAIENGSGQGLLLDPETGAVQTVRGEFRPWFSELVRPQQPTGKPNEVWAAIYDGTTRTTTVGRYDIGSFSFTPVIELPGLSLSSQDVWVDAAAGKLYLTYRGDLLRLPLPGQAK
ncbi:MAG TPA: HEAT repeat domain-containing protein [Blastocatellia bacterium]|nr:HEAT repeat domain-containing protein [Blastocatellia bacterium]